MHSLTLAAVVASIAAGIVGLYLAGSRRRVNEAHAAEALTNAATALIEPLQSEIARLRERVAAQDTWSKKQDEAIAKLDEQHSECLQREAELSARISGLTK